MSPILDLLAIYAPIVMIVVIMLCVSVLLLEGAIPGEPLLLGRMMLRHGVRAPELTTGLAGYKLAQAVNRCRRCSHKPDCARWLDEDGEPGYETFCPNAAFIQDLKR